MRKRRKEGKKSRQLSEKRKVKSQFCKEREIEKSQFRKRNKGNELLRRESQRREERKMERQS